MGRKKKTRKAPIMDSFAEHLKVRAEFTRSKTDLWMVENGRHHQVDEDTYRGKRMPMKQCFENAYRLIITDHSLTYCEGYISVYGIPIHHAWVIDINNKVRDPTLRKDNKVPIREYFGVAFNTDYVMKALLINETYGLLDGYYNRKTVEKLIEGHEKNWRGR
jgi:hypothetical protein